MLGREEDEPWAGAKPLQPRTWPRGCSFPTEPSTQPKVLFCGAARPAAALAPALVGSPPHPPQLSSALYPGLCQVGAGEWPLNPFASQEPSEPCARPNQTITWAQPHPFPPTTTLSRPHQILLLILSPVGQPLWLLAVSSGLWAAGLCRHLGSLAAWLPWHHGSRSGGTTALGNQGRQGPVPSSCHSSALRPLCPSPS